MAEHVDGFTTTSPEATKLFAVGVALAHALTCQCEHCQSVTAGLMQALATAWRGIPETERVAYKAWAGDLAVEMVMQSMTKFERPLRDKPENLN